MGSYGGPLDDRPSAQYGEYTCYGADVLATTDEADEAADEWERKADAAIQRRKRRRRHLDSLESELAALEDDESAAGIDAYNAKVDEFNEARIPHNQAVGAARRAVRRYNELARRYNWLLETECEKEDE